MCSESQVCEHERLECVQRVKYVSMRGWSVFRETICVHERLECVQRDNM